jgi:hypothetical protein
MREVNFKQQTNNYSQSKTPCAILGGGINPTEPEMQVL